MTTLCTVKWRREGKEAEEAYDRHDSAVELKGPCDLMKVPALTRCFTRRLHLHASSLFNFTGSIDRAVLYSPYRRKIRPALQRWARQSTRAAAFRGFQRCTTWKRRQDGRSRALLCGCSALLSSECEHFYMENLFPSFLCPLIDLAWMGSNVACFQHDHITWQQSLASLEHDALFPSGSMTFQFSPYATMPFAAANSGQKNKTNKTTTNPKASANTKWWYKILHRRIWACAEVLFLARMPHQKEFFLSPKVSLGSEKCSISKDHMLESAGAASLHCDYHCWLLDWQVTVSL